MSFFSRTKHEKKATPVDPGSNIHQVADPAAGTTSKPSEDETNTNEPDVGDSNVTAAPEDATAAVEMTTEEPTMADDTPEEITTSSITVAPTVGETQFTTTSMTVMSDSSLTTDESSKKHRGMSKLEAAREFVYGRSEEPWTKPTGRPSMDETTTFRGNRAHDMRRTCVMKRIHSDEEERSRIDELEAAWTANEGVEPIVARTVPKFIYKEPKIEVKNTKSTKFRYLYNRRPPGVRVYFKLANQDEKKKPPFIATAVSNC